MNTPKLQVAYEPSPVEVLPIRKATRLESIRIAGLRVEHSIPAEKRFLIPIFFVHGMWCTGEVYRRLMLEMAEFGYECFSLTLRGHEDDYPIEKVGAISIADHIGDVGRVLTEFGQGVILAGHSMGALVTARVAGQNPEFIAAHIGLASAPPRWVLLGKEAYHRLPKYLNKMILRQSILPTVDDSLALLFNTLTPRAAEAFIRRLRHDSGLVALEIATWKFQLERLACPSLLIGATFDNFTPHQQQVASRLGADFLRVPCSHMMMIDPNFKSVVWAIDDWLKRKLSQAYV